MHLLKHGGIRITFSLQKHFTHQDLLYATPPSTTSTDSQSHLACYNHPSDPPRSPPLLQQGTPSCPSHPLNNPSSFSRDGDPSHVPEWRLSRAYEGLSIATENASLSFLTPYPLEQLLFPLLSNRNFFFTKLYTAPLPQLSISDRPNAQKGPH